MNGKNNLNTTTTAILLFAQTERTEALSKKISSYSKNNILLWKKLNQKAIHTVQKTKLPYFISDETTQIGTNFGTKITAAVQSVFDQGFEKVIVIGNDSLAMSSTVLLHATQRLQEQDIVLGSDWNGGVYLMGISKKVFNPKEFEAIAWQSHTVFKGLKDHFENLNIFLLPRLKDCNDTRSFRESASRLHYFSKLRAFLMALMQERFSFFTLETVTYFTAYFKQFYNKGSPELA
ncbi:DUF2064 domain-containing protein [Flavobacterium ovatum]|uniref:DUF2064 domain-containing protein n=1 Tax=Flavobacterium ovatum TaxID=1928857 RepID=UPI00344F56C1